MNELTLEQALDNMDKVCAAFRGTRIDHELLLQSLAKIRLVLNPPPAPPALPEPPKDAGC